MVTHPQVTIVIVSFNTEQLTVNCIKSIKKFVKVSYEIIVVDNASKDKTVKELRRTKKEVRVIENKKNLGFAKANNQAIEKARGKYVLLLNSDTLLIEDSVSEVLAYMEDHKKIGVASCKLLNVDGSIQPTGGYFPTPFRVFSWMSGLDDIPLLGSVFTNFHPKASFYTKDRDVDWVTGAFFMVRKEVFEKAGYLDEDYFMYVEEMDFCYRAKKAGFLVEYISKPQIIHFGRASAPSSFAIENELKNQILFFEKHKGNLQKMLVRVIFRFGSLLRGLLYAILGRENERKVYFKLAFTL